MAQRKAEESEIRSALRRGMDKVFRRNRPPQQRHADEAEIKRAEEREREK
jgi:hypothetical protein